VESVQVVIQDGVEAYLPLAELIIEMGGTD
jgi:hypothetical protein